MSTKREYEEEDPSFLEYSRNEDPEELHHRRAVRKRLEERLEQKRLKEELEDWDDDDFDWNE